MPKRAAHPDKTGGSKLTVVLLSMCFAAIVWAMHLTIVYGAVTLACARATPSAMLFGLNLPAFIVAVATLAALAAILAGYYRADRKDAERTAEMREERQFERRVTQWLSLLAAFGVFWAGAAAFLVSPCLALR